MVIDSSRFGNAPVTLSKTAVSGSRASVLPSDEEAGVGQRGEADGADHVVALRVDDGDASFPAVVGAFALGQRARIAGGLQRQELRDEHPASRRR